MYEDDVLLEDGSYARAMLFPRRIVEERSYVDMSQFGGWAAHTASSRFVPLKQILFVQGGGEGAHDEWDNKLVESLRSELGSDYEILYPKMPNEGDPSFAVWRAALETELARLGDDAILIGHSIGGTILINVLAEDTLNREPRAIFLIAAPFVGQSGWPSNDFAPHSDLQDRLPHGVSVFLYHGSKDEIVPFAHVDLYAEAIPYAHVRRLSGRDHQLNNNLSEIAADIRELR